ncbi:MAG: cytochrome b/b6 domain-containing protein [Candidatus Marinimicrobia bacterium]|nr:cytochrome b/b6 domain-containing protein [Candidatus Neomarinimicrobiota bacterium]
MQVQVNKDGLDRAHKVIVWNLPVRVFHWMLVGCFVTAWLTRDDRYLDIHVFAGYLMGGLILFRLVWGVIGCSYARFRDFAFNWNEVWGYIKKVLKGCPSRFIGHNPAGSWAIYLLLSLGGMIAISGLLTLGGEEQHGPLAGLLNYPQGAVAHDLHELLAWIMLGVVVIHLLGVLVETVLHRENLIGSMITGSKYVPSDVISVASRKPTAALMLAVMVTAGISWFYGYLVETPEQPYRPFVGQQLPDNRLWREECGACHLAFHSSLLPARSWQAMMDGQSSHFGEDLYLEQDAIDEIQTFLVDNSAEKMLTEAAWKINQSIPKADIPLRVIETRYWMDKHQEISAQIWEHPIINGKINCAACHLDADDGTFEDAAMRIPAEADKSFISMFMKILKGFAHYFSFSSSPPNTLEDKS